jgi:DNA-binding winged helix-turn-helix (wHTH) protein/tetratricopeptide (TPR) repeat protein
LTIDFGPFRLDEAARVLRLDGRETPLQPRVFDLLVYLVRHRARVVSKDELLDSLWPGVTVTDNSLQRAVSMLRGVLREGGMEDAVRNFPRSGYRFCAEPELDASAAAPPAAPLRDDGDIDGARRASEEQRWGDAIAAYEACGLDALGADDLDRWATALQCIGKPHEAVPVLMRCCALHAQAGHSDAAAANAVALSCIHLERGDIAVAKGWLARGQALVASAPVSPGAGLVLWLASRLAAYDADLKGALALADEAYNMGRQCAAVNVESLGLVYRGFYRVSLGDTRGGLADQDHAAALALSHQIDPMTGGVLYCNILWVCRTFGDWARANQWTLGYQQFCSTSRMSFSGSCQLHRAEALGIQGSLPEAQAHIEDALERLPDDAPWALGDAYRVLGDIQAAIGDTDAAFQAYDKSYALGWNPEPGRAMLLLERGDIDAAYTALERSLIGQSWWTLQRQGILLAHLALVAAHAGRREKAKALIDDLAGQNERWPMPSIRALTNEASAILALKQDIPGEALGHLHLARQLWTSVDSRLNAARLRLEIATLQIAQGDKSGAATELRAARGVIGDLKSGKLQRVWHDLDAQTAAAV